MGTLSTKKFFKNNAGTVTEEAALRTSAGGADADKIPATDPSGRLDVSFMPTGIGPDISSAVSSENLAAGDLVNVYNNTGTANVRKADASVAGKEANGFVLAAVTAPAVATVYHLGINAQVSALTPGPQFLSTTPGLATNVAPSAAGNVVQRIGTATTATSLYFFPSTSFVLA